MADAHELTEDERELYTHAIDWLLETNEPNGKDIEQRMQDRDMIGMIPGVKITAVRALIEDRNLISSADVKAWKPITAEFAKRILACGSEIKKQIPVLFSWPLVWNNELYKLSNLDDAYNPGYREKIDNFWHPVLGTKNSVNHLFENIIPLDEKTSGELLYMIGFTSQLVISPMNKNPLTTHPFANLENEVGDIVLDCYDKTPIINSATLPKYSQYGLGRSKRISKVHKELIYAHVQPLAAAIMFWKPFVGEMTLKQIHHLVVGYLHHYLKGPHWRRFKKRQQAEWVKGFTAGLELYFAWAGAADVAKARDDAAAMGMAGMCKLTRDSIAERERAVMEQAATERAVRTQAVLANTLEIAELWLAAAME